MAASGSAIFVAVMALALYAVFARGNRPRRLGRSSFVVVAGAAFPTIALGALLVWVLSGTATLTRPPGPEALRIEVIGRMWWWEVRYLDAEGETLAIAANEIHLPTDRPALLELSTVDVIHSFWVPRLAGKLDMIPGHVNRLKLQADRPGVFRGQCAEFCGKQHALMAFRVVAHEPTEFEEWLAKERGPAREPDTAELQRGRDLFLSTGCGACHAIRGTPAEARIGPDLTHVGSRLTLAAGILDNHVGTFAGWIADAQGLKPGNGMPSFNVLPGRDLRALAAYLESLQ